MFHARPDSQSDADPDLDEDGLDAREAANAERRRLVLQVTADQGVGLNRLVLRRVELEVAALETGAPLRGPAWDPGLAYERIAKAIRMTVALEDQLESGRLAHAAKQREARKRARSDAAIKAFAEGLDARFERNARDRSDVREALEGLIVEQVEDERIADKLERELDERLETAEEFDLLRRRPVSEIIALIAKELGLSPDWTAWIQTQWATEEAIERPKGSPYAGPLGEWARGAWEDGAETPAAGGPGDGGPGSGGDGDGGDGDGGDGDGGDGDGGDGDGGDAAPNGAANRADDRPRPPPRPPQGAFTGGP